MSLTKTEQAVIRSAIKRLEGDSIDKDLRRVLVGHERGELGLYLSTWVIPQLKYLLPEHRDVDLAAKMATH